MNGEEMLEKVKVSCTRCICTPVLFGFLLQHALEEG